MIILFVNPLYMVCCWGFVELHLTIGQNKNRVDREYYLFFPMYVHQFLISYEYIAYMEKFVIFFYINSRPDYLNDRILFGICFNKQSNTNDISIDMFNIFYKISTVRIDFSSKSFPKNSWKHLLQTNWAQWKSDLQISVTYSNTTVLITET